MKTGNSAADELRELMGNWSEDVYCAGWMIGLEYALWRIVLNKGGNYGLATLSAEDAAQLETLAREADGWWVWDDQILDEKLVPLTEWRQMYERKQAS